MIDLIALHFLLGTGTKNYSHHVIEESVKIFYRLK
jgi:hypothetical protein